MQFDSLRAGTLQLRPYGKNPILNSLLQRFDRASPATFGQFLSQFVKNVYISTSASNAYPQRSLLNQIDVYPLQIEWMFRTLFVFSGIASGASEIAFNGAPAQANPGLMGWLGGHVMAHLGDEVAVTETIQKCDARNA